MQNMYFELKLINAYASFYVLKISSDGKTLNFTFKEPFVVDFL